MSHHSDKRGSAVRRVLLVPVALAIASIGTGCVGNTTRDTVLSPLVENAWPDIKSDAEIGVSARNNSAASQALGIQAISDAEAETARVNINEFDRAVRKQTRTP